MLQPKASFRFANGSVSLTPTLTSLAPSTLPPLTTVKLVTVSPSTNGLHFLNTHTCSPTQHRHLTYLRTQSIMENFTRAMSQKLPRYASQLISHPLAGLVRCSLQKALYYHPPELIFSPRLYHVLAVFSVPNRLSVA